MSAHQPSSSEVSSFGRKAKPFASVDAAHAIVKAAEQVGWNISDVEKFLRQIQHVEYGLSSEMEFAAILRWLGWCAFVHRLSEDVLEDPARNLWIVPDLLAVFAVGGRTCSVLIEVKTGDDMVLTFRQAYLQRLRAYAQLVNQPLLVAWRPRPIGFWVLFDPDIAKPIDEGATQVDFDLAVKHDLMSLLAGDYWIVPRKGAGLRIEYERNGQKQPIADGYEAVFRVSDAYFHDAACLRAPDLPHSIAWAILSVVTDHQEVTDDKMVQSFVASGGTTRAQLVLRTAVGFSLKDHERIHWKEIAKNLDGVLSCEALLNDAQTRFGTFMNYIFHQQPQKTPSFIPADWQGYSAQKSSEPRCNTRFPE